MRQLMNVNANDYLPGFRSPQSVLRNADRRDIDRDQIPVSFHRSSAKNINAAVFL